MGERSPEQVTQVPAEVLLVVHRWVRHSGRIVQRRSDDIFLNELEHAGQHIGLRLEACTIHSNESTEPVSEQTATS